MSASLVYSIFVDMAAAAAAAPRKRPSWVFMMFDALDETRSTTSIDVSHNPASAVAQFNSGARAHRKNCKRRRRDWKLEEWVGPFARRRAALAFQARWARAACAFDVRARRGAELAREQHLDIFSFHDSWLAEILAQPPPAPPASKKQKTTAKEK
jgi:hypothetical protein